jgi:pantoate--beta-alanine ligase
MARDLDLPVEIVGRPIVREPDGLAMSSRNTYLSPEERSSALCLHRALKAARRLVGNRVTARGQILAVVKEIIEQAPHTRIDYLALVHPETLEEVETVQEEARLLLAVRVGNTRLIDNFQLRESPACCV